MNLPAELAAIRALRYANRDQEAIVLIDRLRDFIEAQATEIERLRTRLEVPAPPFEAHDGISCRDETIKLLDHNADVLREALKLAKAEIERLGTLISP